MRRSRPATGERDGWTSRSCKAATTKPSTVRATTTSTSTTNWSCRRSRARPTTSSSLTGPSPAPRRPSRPMPCGRRRIWPCKAAVRATPTGQTGSGRRCGRRTTQSCTRSMAAPSGARESTCPAATSYGTSRRSTPRCRGTRSSRAPPVMGLPCGKERLPRASSRPSRLVRTKPSRWSTCLGESPTAGHSRTSHREPIKTAGSIPGPGAGRWRVGRSRSPIPKTGSWSVCGRASPSRPRSLRFAGAHYAGHGRRRRRAMLRHSPP